MGSICRVPSPFPRITLTALHAPTVPSTSKLLQDEPGIAYWGNVTTTSGLPSLWMSAMAIPLGEPIGPVVFEPVEGRLKTYEVGPFRPPSPLPSFRYT